MVSNNIYQAARGMKNMVEMPEFVHIMQMIPIGKNNGLFVFNNMVRLDD